MGEARLLGMSENCSYDGFKKYLYITSFEEWLGFNNEGMLG